MMVMAATDDSAVADDDSAYGGIGAGLTRALHGLGQRLRHERVHHWK